MKNPGRRKESGPGVPEAVPRGLQHLVHRYGAEALDRVWVFPPLVSGRRESGLLVASVFADGPEAERRVLVSSPYIAERTGKGLRIDRTVQEQGEAPADRFPRVVEGVVRRAEKDLGEPRELVVEGVEAAVWDALGEYPLELLDPELPPRTSPSEEAPDAGDEQSDEATGSGDSEAPGVETTLAGEAP